MPRIEVRGSRVEYLEQGRGDPVVLLHSSASSGAQWRALAGELSARYRVIAPDLYGYGGTDHWPGREAFTLAHEAEIVGAVLGRAGPAHVVGHSYGGALALHVARTRSDLVRSLVLIEPVAFHLLHERAEIMAVAQAVWQAVACGDYVAGCRLFVDYWSGSGSWDEMPGAKRDALTPRLAKVALDFHAALGEPAGAEDYRRVAAPALLVQGARSPAPTRRVCALLARLLMDPRLRTLDGAGHMAPITHRDAVNALVTEHISTQPEEVSHAV